MDHHRIIMNYATPPSHDDLEMIAKDVVEHLPEELLECCNDLTLRIEDFPDEAMESELDLDDQYDLLAFYRSGKEILPGVQKKVASEDDMLILFRRPILDLWCETGDDLSMIVREIIIEELGQNFDFSEDEIEEMTARHHQGMF